MLPGVVVAIVGVMRSVFGIAKVATDLVIQASTSGESVVIRSNNATVFQDANQNELVKIRSSTGVVGVGGKVIFGSVNDSGGATTVAQMVVKVTGIADAAATDVLTVTVPNANHAATIKLLILSSNGSTDAFESSRVATGTVILARLSGGDTVAAVSALEAAQIATTAAGATHTLAYGVSAISGASSATQTFTIQLTINDSGNVGSNQAVIMAECLNAQSSGVTIASV